MEVNGMLDHIFGEGFHSHVLESSGKSSTVNEKTFCLDSVIPWIQRVLDDLDARTTETPKDRLGPSTVQFDLSNHSGLFMISKERLGLSSQCNFGTIRANTCVFKGKWQYEVNLGTNGVMQIGWATIKCKFSQEIGVGDTIDSYAFDGNRIRKWNVSTCRYGEAWLSGDTISCTIDLDQGIVAYYRNGRPLGIAFENIQMGPGVSFFPTVSLAFTEQLIANFGATPLHYPIPGFQPIQGPPTSKLAKAKQLCIWLVQLLKLFETKHKLVGQLASTLNTPMSNESVLMGIAGALFSHLAPLLAFPYIGEACLVPLLENYCRPTSGKSSGSNKKMLLMIVLDMMWAFMEEYELQICFESLLSCIVTRFRQVSVDLQFASQKSCLLLLTGIAQHNNTRQHLLENILFEKSRFAHFMHIKPLEKSTLERFVKNPWWESDTKDKKHDSHKASFLKASQEMKESVSTVESMQVEFLSMLLTNVDSLPTRPSSRKIFLRKFRAFLHENVTTNQALPMLHMPHHIALCCFYRLVAVVQVLWAREVAPKQAAIPTQVFYDCSIDYFHMERVGGLAPFLMKTLRADLIRALGEDHAMFAQKPESTPANQSFSGSDSDLDPLQLFGGSGGFIVPIMSRFLAQQRGSIGNPLLIDQFHFHSHGYDRRRTKVGEIKSAESLIELIDGLVLFYHSSIHSEIAKMRELHAGVDKYAAPLADCRQRLESARRGEAGGGGRSYGANVVKELQRTCEVYEKELSEQARNFAWLRATDLSYERQNDLVWLLRIVLEVVKASANEGLLFGFLPDFYLDSMAEICLALRSYFPPTAAFENVEGHDVLLMEMAQFLCDHFADPRIIQANCKDTMIHALASFVCSPNTLQAMERVPKPSRINMVCSLLRPYENRAWAQSNSVLVRIWQGCGFAFRYHKSPHLQLNLGPKLMHADSGLIFQTIKPCPSRQYQLLVQEVMLANDELTIAFINSLLNQLNWAFSEFIGMLQEIQNVANRSEQIIIESRQLRICATCFDLALALLRVLEMVASIALQVFTDPKRPSAELLLARLCQLLCQVLNRVSSNSGCFQHVVQLQKPDLDSVDHFPILAAVVGILAALLAEDMQSFRDDVTTVPKVSKALLTEPSFQIVSLHFVLGDMEDKSSPSTSHSNKKSPSKAQNLKPFSFHTYPEDVSPEEISLVRGMINMLVSYQAKLTDIEDLSDDDLCTICYAYPALATFKPCNHESCSSCIAHHLMNSHICFFCKADIHSVVDNNGKILHNIISPVPLPHID